MGGFSERKVERSLMVRGVFVAISFHALGQGLVVGQEVVTPPHHVVVPLRDGKFLQLADLRRNLARASHGTFSIPRLAEDEVEVPGRLKEALALAVTLGWIDKDLIRFEKDSLIIRLPNVEDPESRVRFRKGLKMLGLPVSEWSIGKGLMFPETLDPKVRTIVFVHGLGSNCRSTFDGFIRKCGSEGVQALTFEYPNQGPIDISGKRLGEELRELARRWPSMKAAIVAHSMGGLVARHALEATAHPPTCVSDLVMLGTPQEGSLLARYSPAARLAESLWKGSVWRDFVEEGLGEAGEDLYPGSLLLRNLASVKRGPEIKYHLVLGSRAVIDRNNLPGLVAEWRRIGSNRLAWSRSAVEEAAEELQSMDELIHGAGDGAVALRRAKLSGVASEAIFDLNHMELARGPGNDPVWDHIRRVLGWRNGGNR